MKNINPTNRQGFTLIELLVVVAIIGILASMLMPALAAAKKKASRVKCANNMKQYGQVFNGFASDHKQRLPWLLSARDGSAVYSVVDARAPKNVKTNNKGRENNKGSWTHAMDIGRVWNAVDIGKVGLRTVNMLASPLDPDAKKANDAEFSKLTAKGKRKKGVSGGGFATASTKNKNRGNDIHVNAQSYAIHLGADVQKPKTIVALTRNFRGNAGIDFTYPGGKLSKGAASYPRALRVDNNTRLRNCEFIGKGFRPNLYGRSFYQRSIMSGLDAKQGNVACIDGHTEQVNDARFKEMTQEHAKERGGITAAVSLVATRPTQNKSGRGNY